MTLCTYNGWKLQYMATFLNVWDSGGAILSLQAAQMSQNLASSLPTPNTVTKIALFFHF